MKRPKLDRPFTLPLDRRSATITARSIEPRPSSLLDALDRGAIESTVDLRACSLFEAHLVEAVLGAMGAIELPKTRLTCRNCETSFSIDASEHLPLAPILQGAHDEELDAHHPPGIDHALPRTLSLGKSRSIRTFRLAPRTLDDGVRLHELLGPVDATDDTDTPAPLPLAPPLVRALGLSLGDVVSPAAITRALERLDDDAFADVWSAIADAYEDTHYSPRLLAPVTCPSCGARHDVDVPRRPMLDVDRPAPARSEFRFPTLADFRARAAAITREEIVTAGLADDAHIEVEVDDDTPPCDDGGEPLLGSYTPDHAGEPRDLAPTQARFRIALYYRTFRSMFEEEPYDVDAEIRETIEHELEHHVNFLLGDDPLDREEHAQIERERRRVYGERTFANEVSAFFRATWFAWVAVAVIALIIAVSSR